MRIAWLVAALLLASCGDGAADVATGSRDPAQRYSVDATVLSNASHGPELCAGAIAASLPPQCGGPPIVGFDWDDVDGEEATIGVTWAQVHLVGTFDGTALTLTESPSKYRAPRASMPDFSSPCPNPVGGDAVEADRQKAIAYARAQPDTAGVWTDGDTLNLTFTGDLARHEADVRQRWRGPLCVAHHDHPISELADIQRRLNGPDAKAAGVYVLITSINEVRNRVDAEVLIADDSAQRWVDTKFGADLVRLSGSFKPVP